MSIQMVMFLKYKILFKSFYWKIWLFTIILLWAQIFAIKKYRHIFLEIDRKCQIYRVVKIIFLFKIQRIFGHFWWIQQQNWCHILKSVLKKWLYKANSEWFFLFFFVNKFYSSVKRLLAIFDGSSSKTNATFLNQF